MGVYVVEFAFEVGELLVGGGVFFVHAEGCLVCAIDLGLLRNNAELPMQQMFFCCELMQNDVTGSTIDRRVLELSQSGGACLSAGFISA